MRRSIAVVLATALLAGACGGADEPADVDVEPGAAAPATGEAGAGVLAELVVLDPGAERRPAGTDAFAGASTGDELVVADLLRTDATGFVQVDWLDGSLTRLDADTELEVVELAGDAQAPQVRTRLDVGRTWHRVQDLAAGRFEVETAVATVAVRGTAFVVVCLADGTCTFRVVEGAVVVTVGAQEIELGPGDQLTVRPDGTVDGPEPVGLQALLEDPWVERNVGEDGSQGRDPIVAEGGDAGGPFAALGPPQLTDPAGDIAEPALDVVATWSGVTPGGDWWFVFEFAGQWEPPRTHWSWWVELQLYEDGQLARFDGTEWHDGVRTGPTNIAEFDLDGRLLFIAPDPNLDGEIHYRWLTRMTPTPSAAVQEDLPDDGGAPVDFDNVLDPRPSA